MTNQFCHFLTNGYTLNVVNNQLTQRPCCLYPKSIPFNQPELIQKELASNSRVTEWIPECSECQRIEALGIKSMRALSRERVQGSFAPGACVSLEVNFDKKCNAACLSCSPKFSSTWEKYNRKFNLTNAITQADPADLLQQFINTVPLNQLQFLYIQGGEPFYSDTNQRLLEHVLQVHPDPGNIAVHYQTNGSILPNSTVMEYWQQFRSIVVNYSIDDIGDRFDYLRWPLDWATVQQNIQTMIATTTVDFKINSTVNPLNVLYYDRLESWINDTVPADRLLKYRAGACLGNLDLRHTPTQLRAQAIEKYGANHAMAKLFNTTELFDLNNMFKYINTHDTHRRLNWREVFPESVEFFNEY